MKSRGAGEKNMVIVIVCLVVALLYWLIRTQMIKKSPVDTDNAWNFGTLVKDLIRAYETPSEESAKTIAADMEKIRSVKPEDCAVAQILTETWKAFYLNPDYRLFLYGKDSPEALADCGVVNSPAQAIVVLGYALSDGKMQPELAGRCDAAAALAKAFPQAILICTGGATGKNNPEKHTEAGLMKQYLTEHCGIDASRIHTDETARNTVENVRKTFEILERQKVHTITIVTSQYHQKRSQTLYGVMERFCRLKWNDDIRSVGNFCFEKPDAPDSTADYKLAMQGMVELLHIPKEVISSAPSPTDETNPPDTDRPSA